MVATLFSPSLGDQEEIKSDSYGILAELVVLGFQGGSRAGNIPWAARFEGTRLPVSGGWWPCLTCKPAKTSHREHGPPCASNGQASDPYSLVVDFGQATFKKKDQRPP